MHLDDFRHAAWEDRYMKVCGCGWVGGGGGGVYLCMCVCGGVLRGMCMYVGGGAVHPPLKTHTLSKHTHTQIHTV